MKKSNYKSTIISFSKELQSSIKKIRSLSSKHIKSLPQLDKIFSPLKRWHIKSIEEILMYDSMKKADQKKPIGEGIFREWVLYMQNLWRLVNDSIVWLICNDQRHILKQLCLHRERGPLSEANFESVYVTLELLNSDPYSIAVWNDATSFVDIGDITYLNKRVNNISFIELKGGDVNAEIISMMKVKDDSKFNKRYNIFVQKYGNKGIKHFDRIRKQEVRNKQITNLIKQGRGISPPISRYLEIRELKQLDEYYDNEMNDLLSRLENNINEAYTVIDDCLWIYATNTSLLSYKKINERFKNILLKKKPEFKEKLKENDNKWDVDRINNLNTGLFFRLSRPIFLRKLKPEYIGDILFGDLRNRILLYLDWDQFGKLISEKGVIFYWSSEKQARRERSKNWVKRGSVIVNGRLPLLKKGAVKGAISGPMMIRLLFDGIRPGIIAEQLVETLQLQIKKGNNKI